MYQTTKITHYDNISSKDKKIFDNLIEIGWNRTDVRPGLRVSATLQLKGARVR